MSTRTTPLHVPLLVLEATLSFVLHEPFAADYEPKLLMTPVA